jgi:hypothetical protein
LFKQVEITNFHAFFQRFVFAYAGYLGLGCTPDIPCPSDWTAKVCECVPELADVRKGRDKDTLMSCLEFADGCFPPQLSKKHHALQPRVRDAVLNLNAKGFISQSDLAYHFARLLKRSPFVLSCLRRKYPFLVLDEYQDTSDLQDGIVRELLGENGKAVVMSDELQMIHEWRGASGDRIAKLKRDIRPCLEMTLRELPRYECAAELGRLFVDMRPELKAEPFCVIESHPCRLVEVMEAPLAPDQKAQLERAEPEKVAHLRDQMHARSVVWHVLKLRRRGVGVGQGTLALLFAGNDEVGMCKRALRRGDIPVRELSNGNKQHDFVGLLLRASGVLTSEERRRVLLEILAGCALQPVRDGMTWESRLEDLRRNPKLPIQGRKPDIRSQMGLDDIATKPSSFGELLSRLAQVMDAHKQELALDYDVFTLLRKCAERARRTDVAELREHLRGVMLQQQYLTSTWALRGVYVLNVHQAKGREFDCVILPNVSQGRFNPSERSDRNLFYVAITRAKRKVIIYDRPDRSQLLDLLSVTGTPTDGLTSL